MSRFRNNILFLLAAASFSVIAAQPARAQTARVETIPLFTDYDLDTPGEGTDSDQILQSVNLTNTSFTLDGDVAECREVTVTVTDTTDTINAGTVTVTGVDCEGDAIVWVIDVSGHAGGAVVYNSTNPTESGREDYYFSSVTDITAAAVATLGGGGDELIEAGILVDTVIPISCVTYGGTFARPSTSSSWRAGNAAIETSGASNTVSGVNSDEDAFLRVDVGDEIRIYNQDSDINGLDPVLYRVVVTNADDDTITVNDPDLDLDDDANGYRYEWRERVCSQSENEGWVDVAGAEQVTALIRVDRFDVDSEDGIQLQLQCKGDGADPIIQNVTTTDVTAVGTYPLTTTNTYSACRVNMLLDSFDSSSDTGAEIEDLDGVMYVRYIH